MQKSYECEVATHIGPESCGAARKSSVEALTGEHGGPLILLTLSPTVTSTRLAIFTKGMPLFIP